MEWPTSSVTTFEHEALLRTQLTPYTKPRNMRVLARNLSPQTLFKIEELAKPLGFNLRQACSLRRGYLKSLMGIKKFMELQGNDHSVGRDISTVFEHVVGDHITACTGVIPTTEQQRKDAHHRGPNPDFTFDPPIVINGKPICWVDAKMIYASRIFIGKKYMAEHKLADTATRYTNVFGPGAFVFGRGFCSELRSSIPAMLLDKTPLDMKPVNS